MDLPVLNNLITLPAFWISILYLIILPLSRWCVTHRNKLEWNQKFIIILYNIICIITGSRCVLNGFNEFEDHGSLRLNHFESEELFFVYNASKYVELVGMLVMYVCLCNHKIDFSHISNDLPMLILADYSFNHSQLEPMCIVVIMNSAVQVIIHSYTILSVLCGVNSCWRTLTTLSQIIEYIVFIILSIIGYLEYGYSLSSVVLSISLLLIIVLINGLIQGMENSGEKDVQESWKWNKEV